MLNVILKDRSYPMTGSGFSAGAPRAVLDPRLARAGGAA
jgi:hypothetical protein